MNRYEREGNALCEEIERIQEQLNWAATEAERDQLEQELKRDQGYDRGWL